MQSEICKVDRQAYLVKSCTECNTGLIDGEPSVAVAVHRALLNTEWGLNCRKCPVFLGLTDEEWGEIIADMDGEE